MHELQNLNLLPVQFLPAFFRIAGIMLFAPLLGSKHIPRRLRGVLAALLACAAAATMPVPVSPGSQWELVIGLGSELLFGIAMGMVLSMAFVAAQFAGAVVGQVMGLSLAGSFDPSRDLGNNPLGDVYFVLTMFLFLVLDGHHAMILGIRSSFDYLPPLSAAGDARLLEIVTGMAMGATTLAVRVAAPLCVVMLVVDLALGMIGRTIPQMNLMTIGLSLRSLAGLVVMILGLGVAASVLAGAIHDGMTLADGLLKPALH